MQLQPPPGPANLPDLATAVADGAARLGHRPAITYLAPAGRQEQSYASLAQWASKGAHWLALDQLLEPGAVLGIAGPPGWVPAAAALGAWWAGCAVTWEDGLPDADVVVAHHDHVPAVDVDVLVWGDGFDGAPPDPGPHEPYAHAVQPFPDQPPPAAGAPDVTAVVGSRPRTHDDLLHDWVDATKGAAGVTSTTPAAAWLPAVAVRPLVTGRPTVVLGVGVDPDAAAGDRVGRWI